MLLVHTEKCKYCLCDVFRAYRFFSHFVLFVKMQHALILDLNVRNLRQQQARRVYHPRSDPTEYLTDFEFKRHFRFNKESVRRLAEMLDLEPPNNRGLPLSPLQSTCIALNHFAGAHFTRVSAYCGNVSYCAAWNAVDRVRDALCRLQDEYILMPSEEEMAATARRMEEKFHLPRYRNVLFCQT